MTELIFIKNNSVEINNFLYYLKNNNKLSKDELNFIEKMLYGCRDRSIFINISPFIFKLFENYPIVFLNLYYLIIDSDNKIDYDNKIDFDNKNNIRYGFIINKNILNKLSAKNEENINFYLNINELCNIENGKINIKVIFKKMIFEDMNYLKRFFKDITNLFIKKMINKYNFNLKIIFEIKNRILDIYEKNINLFSNWLFKNIKNFILVFVEIETKKLNQIIDLPENIKLEDKICCPFICFPEI